MWNMHWYTDVTWVFDPSYQGLQGLLPLMSCVLYKSEQIRLDTPLVEFLLFYKVFSVILIGAERRQTPQALKR